MKGWEGVGSADEEGREKVRWGGGGVGREGKGRGEGKGKEGYAEHIYDYTRDHVPVCTPETFHQFVSQSQAKLIVIWLTGLMTVHETESFIV